jgi:hypothetical protein
LRRAPSLPLIALACVACDVRRIALPDSGPDEDSAPPADPCPALHLSTESLAWSDVSADGIDPVSFSVSNLCGGQTDLVVALALSGTGAAAFAFSPGGATIPPGESAEVTVTFAPEDFDAHAAMLDIHSNASDPDHLSVVLTGNAARDADGDGYDSRAAGGEDCDDRDASVNPGAQEAWYDGVDNDCDGVIDRIDTDAALAWVRGEPYDYLGYRSALAVGDFNANGTLGLLVGGLFAGSAGDGTGGVWLVHDAGLAALGGEISGHADAFISGVYAQNYVGALPGREGDVDGDGADDIFVAGSDRTNGSRGNVAAGLFFDGGTIEGDVTLAEASVTFTGSQSIYSVSAASDMDLDGDGLSEVAYGDWWNGEDFAGLVAVFAGSGLVAGTELQLAWDADFVLQGDDDGDSLGCAISAGDLDRDGYDDLLATAPRSDTGFEESGSVYVVRGARDLPASGHVEDLYDLHVHGSAAEARLGYLGVPRLADLDADGGQDLVLSSPDLGTAFVFLGAADLNGIVDADEADLTIYGEGAGAFGATLATGRALGPGGVDLAIGAPDCDDLGELPSGCDQAGEVYVFAGSDLAPGSMSSTDAALVISGVAPADLLGISLVLGDLTGDAREELLVAAPNAGSARDGYLWVFGEP